MDSFFFFLNPNTVCATEASTVMTTNLLQSVEPQQEAPEELPLLWSLLGCGALSLLKALLSLLTVLVNTVLVS